MFFSIVPSGPPQNITYTATARSILFSWSPILCSQCNGPITSYSIEFQSVVEDTLNITIVRSEVYNATGLTPHSNYTFRVAGVNSNGTGPYSDVIAVWTKEDSKYASNL